jgi:hypothetical protein
LSLAGIGPMNKFRSFKNKPAGQVLLATLLFYLVFIALFVGLYKAGTAYNFKEKSRVGADLTSLSAGAVYSNGLQMVRYSNVILMVAFAFDIVKMVAAAAPLIEAPPLAIAAALEADKINTRSIVQKIQTYAFGVELPSGIPFGAYPALIELEGHFIAGDNALQNNILLPLFLYNIETTKGLTKTVVPDMSLRFRYAGELIPQGSQGLYSLSHNGIRQYFSESQVESALNPRYPKQMRVRRDLPSPFSGMWVRRENNQTVSSDEMTHLLARYKAASWILGNLRGLLNRIKLDATHRTHPHNHTITMVSQLSGQVHDRKRSFTDISSVVLEGGGLAAWDIQEPRFLVHLQTVELTDLPAFQSLAGSMPQGLSSLSRSLLFLGGIL